MSSSLDSLVNNLAKGGPPILLGLKTIMAINANSSFKKESTHMSTWIVGIDSKKQAYLVSNVSIVISTCLELVIQTTSMPAPFGKNLELERWENTMNNKKRSHTQLDSRKQVIAFQDRVITINKKEAQHPLK